MPGYRKNTFLLGCSSNLCKVIVTWHHIYRRAENLKPESVFQHKGELGELSDDVTDSDDESDLEQSKEVNTLSWLKNIICHLEIELEHN